jgi:hypothetical protein
MKYRKDYGQGGKMPSYMGGGKMYNNGGTFPELGDPEERRTLLDRITKDPENLSDRRKRRIAYRILKDKIMRGDNPPLKGYGPAYADGPEPPFIMGAGVRGVPGMAMNEEGELYMDDPTMGVSDEEIKDELKAMARMKLLGLGQLMGGTTAAAKGIQSNYRDAPHLRPGFMEALRMLLRR